MRRYFAFACFMFAVIGLAWEQPTLLYKTGGPHGKYVLVLSTPFNGGVKSSTSDVIMSDSFAVRRDASHYEVILTNAIRFHNESSVQATLSNSVLYIGFPTNTQVLFDNSMTDLGHIQLGGVSSSNKVEYQGEATMPNKDGAANGSQPIRSETNSTPSAAGSRR